MPDDLTPVPLELMRGSVRTVVSGGGQKPRLVFTFESLSQMYLADAQWQDWLECQAQEPPQPD